MLNPFVAPATKPAPQADAAPRFGGAQLFVALGLVLFGAAMRVVPHPWNLTPVGAIALFAGARVANKRLALVVPLAVMLLSDAWLGFHEGMLFVYGSFAAIVCIGMWARRQGGPLPIAAGALTGSLLFFFVTNFGVWLLSDGQLAYPKTLAGLVDCYLMAVPFFQHTLLGDLLFSALLFGLHAAVVRLFARRPSESRA
jgi:hypothetical protein